MKFLGEKKMFDIALSYLDIGICESFNLFSKVNFLQDEDGEYLYLRNVKNNKITAFIHQESESKERFYYSDEDECIIHLNVIFGDEIVVKKEKMEFEERKEGAESCKECLCSYCITRARIPFDCAPCPRCEEEFEENGVVIPVYKCNKFEPDNL